MTSRSDKNILITGADGLLGYAIQRLLANSNFGVHAVVRKTGANRIEAVDYIEIDFSQKWHEAVIPENVNVVIHLAQSALFRDFPDSALDVFKVNVETTARLLDLAYRRQVQNFIFASSGGIYGSGSQAFKENSPLKPLDHLGYYLGSKICGETLAQSYAGLFDVQIIRPFFMYGARQNRSMLIPRLVDTIRAGNEISLQGKQGIRINPVHVDDAARAVFALIDRGDSMTINVAGPEVISLRRICEIIGQQLDCEPRFAINAGQADDLIGDISAMKQLIGAEMTGFATGVTEMLS